MEIRLLGVVEVTVENRLVPLSAAKQRAVLAMLALAANTPVSIDRIIEGLWGEHAPASAQKLVQQYVSQLRKVLAGGTAEIVTRGRGYELRVPADCVDALRFERMVEHGAARDALALWRGPPLDDLADEPFAAAEIRRLEELRLRAHELAIDGALAAGDPGAVIAELEQLVDEHPLRERLRAQLMLALYRSGRQAKALDVYSDARTALVEELGIEPSRELRVLQQRILAQDAALDGAPALRGLPDGTVTFLLTDIEGSTRLWESGGDAMAAAVKRHYDILDAAISGHRGVRPVEQGEGDSVVGVFAHARDAVRAALDAQRALHAEHWPEGAELRVRMALHTGDARLRDAGNYFGPAVIRCARLRALARGGQVLLSRATHDLVKDGLPDGTALMDLGEHRLRDLGRPEHVFALRSADLPDRGELPRSPDAPAHNLPHELSSFVGRERELGELRRVLAETRLLTLTGPGGCGKTRLALRAGWELVDSFPGGVWWVELASVGDARLVGAALAEALGVRPLPGVTDLQAAGSYLASRSALVILDNCEHLAAMCARVAETLLKTAAGVVVLATSRAPLGVPGETDWRVPPLAGTDAVSLFVERARKVRPGFALGNGDAASVAGVCKDLDGLPLAIELAAARVRLLSLDQLAAGVSDRFGLLTGGPRTAAERQRTLRGSVDWSHDLLGPDEQRLLRRVAVFAGGFTLDAAEAVCADAQDGGRVLELLGSLVEQSLVIAEERFRLLETVRQYGLERLAAAGEEAALRDRHRDFFVRLAERAAPRLQTAGHSAWVERLDAEAANLAAATDHALSSDPRVALRLCAALPRWWWASGRLAEGELACARALEACGEREPALRARVLQGLARVAITAGDNDGAARHATAALALAEAVGDRRLAAYARVDLGVAKQFADPRAGRAELERAAELARAAHDEWAIALAGQGIALTFMYQHDHRGSARASDDVAALAERLGDPYHVSRRWFYAAWIALTDGRFAEARDALERMLATVEGVADPSTDAFADICLGLMEVWSGGAERALERLHAQLERSLKLGTRVVLPMVIVTIGFAELAAGRFAEARNRLDGLLELVRERDAYSTLWCLCVLAEARRMLGDDAAEATAAEARAYGERIGNQLLATRARLTLGRLAALRGDWRPAREHAQAHLDVCLAGGHATFVPACLDGLAEAAAGAGADRDAARLIAAAERSRGEIGVVRVPAEAEHWAGIERRVRAALGDEAFDLARAEGANGARDAFLSSGSG